MKAFIILLISLSSVWGVAKDDVPKVKGEIISVSKEALTLQIADTVFWVDAITKIEDGNSNYIAFSDLEPGDFVELEYSSRAGDTGSYYATKIERQN
jgi:hypothetical protein